MNFQRGRGHDEPEINLIPLIDVLLVIIIFLMLTTTYSKFSGLEINLPTADASKQAEQPNEVDVAVTASGQILVNKSPLTAADVKTTAIAFFPIPDAFFGKSAGSLRVVKVRRADSVEEFTQVFEFENLTDARFAVAEVEFLPDGTQEGDVLRMVFVPSPEEADSDREETERLLGSLGGGL